MGGTLTSPFTSSSSEEAEAAAAPQAHPDRGGDQAATPSPFDVSRLPAELTSKYEILQKIGSGSFGSVYKVRRLDSSVLYAAKYVETKDNTTTEVRIQANIDDIHVVKIHDTVLVPSLKRVVIIMEYCTGGNLLQWVKRSRRHGLINERLVLSMFREICQAVYNCHQKQVIHRDLKPENILLDERNRIKLADFGVARVLNRKSVAMSFCGTPPYMAPELFLSYMSRGTQNQDTIGYDGKCDVWSIGCILWDMANKSNLFVFELPSHPGLSVARAPSNSAGVKDIYKLVDTDIPDDYVLTRRLLKGMLVNDPDQRTSLSQILLDAELSQTLTNPSSGNWYDVL